MSFEASVGMENSDFIFSIVSQKKCGAETFQNTQRFCSFCDVFLGNPAIRGTSKALLNLSA